MQNPKVRTTFMAIVLLLAAGATNLQAQNAALHFRHAAGNLAKIAEDFGRQFKVQLAYASEELTAVKVPAASYEANGVGELLNKVLAPGGFGAMAAGNSWIIKKTVAKKQIETMVLRGNVKEGNAPVASASVIIKQDRQKMMIAVADDKGNFSKTIPEQDGVLEITAVGYLPVKKKFSAGIQQVVNIELIKDEQQMQNVVVTALGIKRSEKALGYATTTINGDQLTDAMASNWTDALSGKVAGLNLVRSNSGPVGTNKIILRGENNLTGDNEALIVVDGVVINQGSGRRTAISGENVYGTGSDNMPADYGSGLNDINPEDIESVTVLKGPGAAALYGQRAANGAVIITTKSGRRKKKNYNITFNSNASLEQPNRWPDLQYQYGQGLAGASYYSYGTTADGASTSGTSSAYGPRFDGQSFFQLDPDSQKVSSVRTPWVPYKNSVRRFFNVGNTLTNSLSVDGGSKKTTARLSFTNVLNNWIVPNTGYKRNTVALSVTSKVTDKLQISTKINYTNKWSDNLPGAGYGNQSIMYWFIFWQPNADINWLKNYWVKGQEEKKIFYPYSSYPENPYAVAYEFINSSNRDGVTGNVQASYTFTKELSLQLRGSLDLSDEHRAQERPYDAGTKFPKGSYRTQKLFSQEGSLDFLLRYAKQVNSNFDFSVTLGGSGLKNKYTRHETRADSLIEPGVYSFDNAAGPLIYYPYKSRYAINSLYGLATAAYKNYLFLDLTGRQDWNSVLATYTRTGHTGFFYPSANLSFVLSDVVKLPSQINFAKLRLSASEVGSAQTTPYLTTYGYVTAGGAYNNGLQNPDILTNPNLKPLSTVTYEAGVNAKFFKNRVGIDLALYTSTTRDQILKRVIDQAAGNTFAIINAGRVDNQGIELALNGTPFTSQKGFRWSTNIVFSSNTNKIKKLADSSVVLYTGPVGGGQIVAKVGGSMGDLYGRGYQRSPDGQVVYDSKTGVALLTDDVKYLGNTIPKWKLGWSNDFAYKQFRLSVLFDAQYGGVAHSLMHYKLSEQGKLTKTLPGRYSGIIGNGVTRDADGKYRKNDVIATNIDEYYRSNFGQDNAEGSVFRTDFIKFREARLDYTLGPKLTKKLHMQRATFGIYGRNLFIWSKWPMFDPEFGTLNGTDIVQGFEIGQFPSTRTLGCNLVVGF
jgi:TonB-linked SusC/RagA family outer membrane protein